MPAAAPGRLTPAQVWDLRCWLADATGLIGDDPDWYLDPANASDHQVLALIDVIYGGSGDQGDAVQPATTNNAMHDRPPVTGWLDGAGEAR